MSVSNVWRACGVDVAKDKKQRQTISGNATFCSILTPMASTVSDQLDVKKFEEGYVCKVCSRELEKMQKLQAQLDEVKGCIFSKLTNAAHLLPQSIETPSETEVVQTPTRTSSRKRASDASSNERRKRRRLLHSAVPSNSTQGSPDVAVSHCTCTHCL